ncbi:MULTISPECIES: hypothetical protein [unclassified Mesorhizobium]|uniref:hypothetical protein n=1 Tax=unclassified Mesorhizobium TaxID=325217 RepID=UPI000F7613C2|nr:MULTISPECIES: hypothetical protein [unclassified Mesorhizobium]RUU68098.1 hypothetical protein EOC99_00625 [Mesorhizobium sp. M7A.T.Ca.TU.009.01.1.1]RUU90198.1 hypothetical protein EOD03_01880 [Mesorhizobium sp. M7A.T.Ca.TU.009.01.1.2]RUV53848.1 hypothetical protein EOB77_00080 [Mesorhizobium sp. M7A.F.Ca.MR.228.00.0.0]RUX07239.1 hypothetical protein EOA30_08900 [Mesorhizobium sp. M8A.F.Ca.ET.059.01.1.1]RUY13281.1 hypothetical protein EOA25_00885 [Mesorhizobium sp. M2A.F.Ca.ET.040.01.1.1]R
MTKIESKTASAAVKDILLSDPDGLHEMIRAVMQEVLEAEMDDGGGDHRAHADLLLPAAPASQASQEHQHA